MRNNPENSAPLITIALISRNMGHSLMDCLVSLSAQTISDFEIVLVDDRSSDLTQELVEKYADPRIRYFRNDCRLGYGGTRNLSLKEARGQYVFFTDADCIAEKT